MKKLLLLPLSAFLISCATPRTIYWGIDYRTYIEEGFFISPLTELSGERFTPIATVGTVYEYAYPVDSKTYEELLPEVVEKAGSMGANGLVGLKTSSRSVKKGWQRIEIEGVAVKIDGRVTPSAIRVPSAPKTSDSGITTAPKGYNFEAIKNSGKELVVKIDGVKYYYDVETDQHISKDDFLNKYMEIDFLTIEQMYKITH